MTWWWGQLQRPLLDHVPHLPVDRHRPDVLPSTFYPVQLRLGAAMVVRENYFPELYSVPLNTVKGRTVHEE